VLAAHFARSDPELRETWFRFHDARFERRAIRWLLDEGLVDEAVAERAIAERPDPEAPELSGPFDPHAVARDVATDLRRLYGGRLSNVILFGSWARGDAHPESDIDLLGVLDHVDSVWESDLESQQKPLLVRAGSEGLPVG
jgi:Nucleotidyltransferase domain